MQALLAANADVNPKTGDEYIPLTLASANGRADLVRLLLAVKADVNAAKIDGKTALMVASANGRLEVVQALLAAKADVSGEGRRRMEPTVSMLAVVICHQEVAKLGGFFFFFFFPPRE